MAELDVTYRESIDGHGSDFEFEPPDAGQIVNLRIDSERLAEKLMQLGCDQMPTGMAKERLYRKSTESKETERKFSK